MRYGLVALCAFWFSNLALAFDMRGHAIICQMAYEQLSRKHQERIDSLVDKSPEKQFATACAWPDKARDTKAYNHTKPWHYANVPRSAETVKPTHCPSTGCLLSAIPAMQHRLKDNPQNDWGALLFLSHFMADLHQPMHVSYFDDRGGNRTSVRFNGQNTNLHHLWDGTLLGNYSWKNDSRVLLGNITEEQRKEWRKGGLFDWANESLVLTRDIYSTLPASGKLSESYQHHYAPLLQLQMQKASVRLAYMLESVLDI